MQKAAISSFIYQRYGCSKVFLYQRKRNTVKQRNENKKKETEKTTSDIKYSSNPQEKKDEKQNFKFCWEDFLYKKNKTNAYKTEEKKVPVNGKDLYADIDISVMEAFSGITKSLNVLQRTICPKCKGRKFVNNAKCSHCNGKGDRQEKLNYPSK